MTNITKSTAVESMKELQQQFRTPYTPRIRVQLTCTDPSRTKQEFKEECDMNRILERYQRTGVIEHVKNQQAFYADVTTATSYHEAQNIVIRAKDAFDSLPSTLRARFENDPYQFLDYINDPGNTAEMVKLGLAIPRPESTNEENPPKPPQKAPKEPQKKPSTDDT